MRRWVFNLLSGLCLLLCVILLYSWLRSYLPRDLRMDSDQGRLLIVSWEGSLPRNGAWDDWDPSRLETFKGVSRLWNRMITISDGRWLGFQSTRGRLATMQLHIIAIPFGSSFFPALFCRFSGLSHFAVVAAVPDRAAASIAAMICANPSTNAPNAAPPSSQRFRKGVGSNPHRWCIKVPIMICDEP